MTAAAKPRVAGANATGTKMIPPYISRQHRMISTGAWVQPQVSTIALRPWSSAPPTDVHLRWKYVLGTAIVSMCTAGAIRAADQSNVSRYSPRVNYALHCQGCHLPDGSGMPGKVP